MDISKKFSKVIFATFLMYFGVVGVSSSEAQMSSAVAYQTRWLKRNFSSESRRLYASKRDSFPKINPQIIELSKYGKGLYGFQPEFESNGLSSSEWINFDNFRKKLPNGASEATIRNLEFDLKVFYSEVQGRVPGSKAIYEKVVGVDGKTVGYFKTSYDSEGKLVHIKDKMAETVVFPTETSNSADFPLNLEKVSSTSE